MSYQERDHEVIDYQLWQPIPDGPRLRGPAPAALVPGGYIACVGAAQTFGCFCPEPWPALLGRELGLPVLNLGIAGAGPALFLEPPWRDWIDNARLAVFQVMSGRSADNSRYRSDGRELLTRRSDGAALGADAAWSEVLDASDRHIPSQLLRRLLRRVRGPAMARSLVAETRTNWCRDFSSLLSRCSAPKVLFWFAKRTPEYRPSYRNAWTLQGEFPQLVNREMVQRLTPQVDEYVECVTDRGSPQPLRSRFDGRPVRVDPEAGRPGAGTAEPWTENRYYPSPEMHQDAARALLPVMMAQLGPG